MAEDIIVKDDAASVVMSEKDLDRVHTAQRVMKIIVTSLIYLFLGVMALIVLFPFYWMIISSLKTTAEYRLAVPTLFPQEIMWTNYLEAFTAANLGRLFINTMIVGIISTLLSLVITVLCAFAFARLEFKGKETMFAALLATMMIPGELFTITNYATINQLICISNMENINAVMINDGIPQPQRLKKLNEIAIQQMRILSEVEGRKLLK